MTEALVALCSAALVATCAIGAGSVLCFPARGLSAPHRWILRLVLGLALWPLALLVAYELLGLEVRPLSAIGLASIGLSVAAVQEWIWRRDATDHDRVELGLVMAVGLGFAALAGLLRQPGFELLDPWRHAFGAAWIAESGVLRQPDASFPMVHYVDAYPPLFDVLLSLPVSLFGTVSAAVKGVAALLVATAPLALWILARSTFGDQRRAAMAVLLYAALPSAVPRHLWGHSLAVVLTLAGLASAVELRRRPDWWPALAVSFGCALLAAPSLGIKGGILLLVSVVCATFVDRRWAGRLLGGGAAAIAVSSIWYLPAAARWGASPVALMRQMQAPELRRVDDPITALAAPDEAPLPWAPKPHDRIPLTDLVFFRPHGWLMKIIHGKSVNALIPVGIGVPVLVLIATGLAPPGRTDHGTNHWLTASWLLTATILTLGAPLGVVFFPWRSWLLLAPTMALVAAAGLQRLGTQGGAWPVLAAALAAAHAAAAVAFDIGHGVLADQLRSPAWMVVLTASVMWIGRLVHAHRRASNRWFAAAVLAAHIMVAAPVRATTLLKPMPPRVFYSAEEHRGYLELASTLPRNERVWPLSGGMRFDILVALDLDCTPYRVGEQSMARRVSRGELPPADELASWIKQHNYRWLVVDPSAHELQQALGTPEALAGLRTALGAAPELRESTIVTAGDQFSVWELVDAVPPPDPGTQQTGGQLPLRSLH